MKKNIYNDLKRILFAGLFLFVSVCSPLLSAQESLKKTEIIIIGTLHQEKPSFTSKNLVDILKKVRPDVILIELDSSFFTADFQLKKYYPNSLEDQAIKELLTIYPVKLRPFEIEGRNEFYKKTNYFNQEDLLFEKINELNKTNQLSRQSKNLWKKMRYYLRQRDKWSNKKPEEINSFACDAVLNQKNWYLDQGTAQLIKITPQLEPFTEFSNMSGSFWIVRNDAMIQNIKRYAKEFPGQRLVVITGFEHRYYLRSHLTHDIPSTFMVKEFYE